MLLIRIRSLSVSLALAVTFGFTLSAHAQQPRHGALQIARLCHAGDWNASPLAVPKLTKSLRDELKFEVRVDQKELFPRDPNLVHYPLLYLHGRGPIEFSEQDKLGIRRHLVPGGGTLFADADRADPAFDAAFRRLVAELFPEAPLLPILHDDEFYKEPGIDLTKVRKTVAAGGKEGFPDLEGVKVDGRWVVIYSKLDIGSALAQDAEIAEKGYAHDSALKIASKVVLYATLP